MVCLEEVFIWFKELKTSLRIDLICGLFNQCTPLELRFFGTILEDLGKKDFHNFWENEQKANTESELLKLSNVADPTVRSQLIVALVLLRSTNRSAAAKIYDRLVEDAPALPLIAAEEKCLDEIVLLLTLAARHPAFSFEQQTLLAHKLITLEDKLACPPPRPEFSQVQDLSVYNNSNMVWSTYAPVEASNLPDSELDMIPVLSLYPPLSAAVSAVTTTYVTTWPQHVPNSSPLNVVDSSRAQVTSLELIAVEKNGNFRIRALCLNGKHVEMLKNYQEINNFHQKFLQSLTLIPDTIIPPFQCNNGLNNGVTAATINAEIENVENIKIQLTEYFRRLSLQLHLVDQDLLSYFLTNSSATSPKGLLTSRNKYYAAGYPPPATPLSSQGISPSNSPLSSPVSSPLISPPASETSSRCGSPWQQQLSNQISQQLQLQPNKMSSPRILNNWKEAKHPPTQTHGNNSKIGVATRSHHHHDILNTARFAKYNHKLKQYGDTELRSMSAEDFEKLGLPKGVAAKLRKTLEDGSNPPNGAVNFIHKSNKPTYKTNSSQCNNVGGVVASNITPRSSPSASDYSSPPASPPLMEQVTANRHDSSSEENLNETIKMVESTPVMYQNGLMPSSLSNNKQHCDSALPPPLHPPVMHPFKPHCRGPANNTSNATPHYATVVGGGGGSTAGQIQFMDARLVPLSPTLHVMPNSSVPPPDSILRPMSRPLHLSPSGMLQYNPAMTTGGVTVVNSRSSLQHRSTLTNSTCSSGSTTVVVPSCVGNNTNSRYTPPKMCTQMDLTSAMLAAQGQQVGHEYTPPPPMLFTQPPPPVPSSPAAGAAALPNCLQHCNCTCSNTGVTPTNGVVPPPTLPYTGFRPAHHHHHPQQVFHPLHFIPNGYHQVPTAHYSYTLPNGMQHHHHQMAAHEIMYTTNTTGGFQGGATGTQQQPQFIAFPGKCPFPPLGAPPKIPSCHNCGAQGHRGQECKETPTDDMHKNCQFRINYGSSKQPVDSHD